MRRNQRLLASRSLTLLAIFVSSLIVHASTDLSTNQITIVDAGPDLTISLPTSANLDGKTIDDTLPVGRIRTTTWSKVSGPGTVSFGDIQARHTTVSFDASGTYVLRSTDSDTILSSSEDVAITVNQAATAVPLPDLIAAYAFDEGSGTVTAESPGSTATLNNANWITGRFGKGVAFNGTDSYVEAGGANAGWGTAATFEAWVSLNTVPVELMSVLNKWSQTIDDEYFFGINPNGTLFFAWQTTGGGVYGTPAYGEVSGVHPIPVQTLTHIAVVRNGTNLTFYINGARDVSIDAVDTNPLRLGANTLRIGAQGRGARNRFFNGTIDEVRIYNRALSDDEIRFDSSTPLSLIAGYGFDEGSGGVTSGTPGNPGTVNNASWTPGRFGNALAFNGTNSYVEVVADQSITPGTKATFEAWVYLNAPPSELVSVLNKWNQTAEDEYLFGINQDATLLFAWQTTGGGVYGTPSFGNFSSLNPIPLNALTHVAVVRDGTTVTFYINGNADLSGNVMDTKPFRHGVNTLRIGGQGRGTTHRYMNGIIDEVRIHNRALSQTELHDEMSTSLGVAVNQPPAVDAGSDQTITFPDTVSLNGRASDDGLPAGSTLRTTWSKLSGPGTVTFGDMNAPSTTVSYSEAGSYVLQLSATDGALTSTSKVAVNVLTPVNQRAWSLGYYTPFGYGAAPLPISDIEWGALTHVMHAGAVVRSDGTLDLSMQRVDTDGRALVAAAHSHGVKAVLVIIQAYWMGRTSDFRQAVNNSRAVLVDNITSVVDSYGYDGVDLDIEPLAEMGSFPNFSVVAADLRARLGSRLLTAAAISNDSAFWGGVHDKFDRISLMTYDLAGTWNPYSWHNAALYDPGDGRVLAVNTAVTRFVRAGVPKGKLHIGIPFFGYVCTGSVTAPKQPWGSTSCSQQDYRRLAASYPLSKYVWDDSAKVPYLGIDNADPSNDRFVTFDNERSVAEKIRYVKTQGLGGWIIWSLVGDYVPSQAPDQPLLQVIKNELTAR